MNFVNQFHKSVVKILTALFFIGVSLRSTPASQRSGAIARRKRRADGGCPSWERATSGQPADGVRRGGAPPARARRAVALRERRDSEGTGVRVRIGGTALCASAVAVRAVQRPVGQCSAPAAARGGVVRGGAPAIPWAPPWGLRSARLPAARRARPVIHPVLGTPTRPHTPVIALARHHHRTPSRGQRLRMSAQRGGARSAQPASARSARAFSDRSGAHLIHLLAKKMHKNLDSV